ncbi:MAG: LacI family DNA-binding transcriptional regulator [Pseudomonadota bacterium]
MSSASIKQVARIAGVSIATVSRFMNSPEKVSEKTREKVQAAIAQTGYTPNTLAQSFRRGRTNIVMVVLPSIGDPFFTGVMRGIRRTAAERGYSILINETQFNTMTADEIAAMVVSRQTDGIILLASMSPFGNEVLSAKSHRALPIVVGCETVAPELAAYPSVHVDNVAAASEATAYLIAQGHRRIGMIGGSTSSLLTRDREAGYRQAMAQAGLEVASGWMVNGDLSIDGAISATRRLLALTPRPTAVFCTTDEMAIGCLHAARSAGLSIPQDLSLMGFDDTRYARVMSPPLTTVSQPAQEIGEQVMATLCAEIERGRPAAASEDAENRSVIVPHQLVLRESVAPPADQV